MVGWHLLLLLAVEIAAYGTIGRHAHATWGWNLAASVALSLGIYLGIRMVLVGLELCCPDGKAILSPPSFRFPASHY
jgi:hypothetical protein